ncbi:MAG: hypothetical protein QM761_11615 [Pseudoxanthomonas sp.]
MRILALAALWLAAAAAQAQEAPAQEELPAQKVKIEVMTCAQLKAEGQRQMAIMQGAATSDFSGDMLDDADMIGLGLRQGRRSVALGAMQAFAGITGGAVAAAKVGQLHDQMSRADLKERNEILDRSQARYDAHQKIENQAGEHFEAITEQYRRRGCAG